MVAFKVGLSLEYDLVFFFLFPFIMEVIYEVSDLELDLDKSSAYNLIDMRVIKDYSFQGGNRKCYNRSLIIMPY